MVLPKIWKKGLKFIIQEKKDIQEVIFPMKSNTMKHLVQEKKHIGGRNISRLSMVTIG